MSQPPGTALVVGALDTPTALGGARALAAAGWRVSVAGPVPQGGRPLTAFSRTVRSVHPTPSAAADAPGFARAVADAAAGLDRPVLLAAGDAELLALAAAGAGLSGVFGVPDAAALHAVLDKRSLTSAAAAAGIATPALVEGEPASWPVVVKAALHAVPGAPGERWEVQLAEGPAELAAARERAAAAGMPLLVQERVEGSLMAVGLVVDGDGQALARVQQVSTTTFPVGAGRTARGVTVEVDDGLAQRCTRLLADAGWVGMAQLQLLVPPTGPPVLIDVNPRLYGSVALAVAAGAPLPDLAARVLRGERPARVPDARAGVRYQWLEGDLRAAAGSAGRVRGAATALLARGATGPVWSARDPFPAAVAVARLAGRALRPR
jgi:predicted ATP-grasp superfamily ATP-dependent carboligase